MQVVRRYPLVWLVVALWMAPAPTQAGSVLVPGIDFSGEDTKINLPMSLIVDVALEPEPYTGGPVPGDIMRKYQQDEHGKYDDRVLPRLSAPDLAAIARYARWLKAKPENQVGSGSQSSGEALFVPEGVALILRPNLAQYRGIEAVYGTLGGGPPYMPGVFVPGEGWSIPFSSQDIRPGTRAVMVIAIDHSNQKKARVLWFDLWNHSGEGRQFGPYEIHVTQAVDQHRRPFQVQSMDAVDVALSYCKGLVPAVTMVSGTAPQTQIIPAPPGSSEPPDAAPLPAASASASTSTSAGEQEATVRLWDARGNLVQQETEVQIYSLAADQSVTRVTLPVLGPTTGRIRRGEFYGVALPRAGFTLDPGPNDRLIPLHGAAVIARPGNENGAVQFDFRQKRAAPRALPSPQAAIPRTAVLSAFGTSARPPSFSPAADAAARSHDDAPRLSPSQEIVVRVSPASLGSRRSRARALPILWIESGKAIRRSLLQPGHTTVVERFPPGARVVPKAGAAGWKISRLPGPASEAQFKVIPENGRAERLRMELRKRENTRKREIRPIR